MEHKRKRRRPCYGRGDGKMAVRKDAAPHEINRFDLFVKIVGKLGSNNAHERAIAAEMATDWLRDAGLTWADVIAPPEP